MRRGRWEQRFRGGHVGWGRRLAAFRPTRDIYKVRAHLSCVSQTFRNSMRNFAVHILRLSFETSNVLFLLGVLRLNNNLLELYFIGLKLFLMKILLRAYLWSLKTLQDSRLKWSSHRK